MAHVAIAAGSTTAAEIGADVVRAGGNAMDAAVAATFATWVCEPGITSMGGGGFICVWPPDGDPLTIDGFVEMPGRTTDPVVRGVGRHAHMDYGGGMDTVVGPGSIGTPGALAALELAWQQWGSHPWPELIAPAIDLARRGFPLPGASHRYFQSSGGPIFDETNGARHLYKRPDGTVRARGETLAILDLADTLQLVADEGAAALYRGELGRRIGDWIVEQGGLLSADDLAAYRPVVRPCLRVDSGQWHLATNPGPAVGGVALVALVSLMEDVPRSAWDAAAVDRFARAMEIVFTDRRQLLHGHGELGGDGRSWLYANLEERRRWLNSPATSQTSVVDSDGFACALTTSTGFGSGVVVPGTGIMLNNMLGEIELSPAGYHSEEVGARIPSNMAPSVARSGDGHALAYGAAGSNRITSALAQIWLSLANLGHSLEAAVAHPRCHFTWRREQSILLHEPGVDVSQVPYPTHGFDEMHMFFGGVQAAARRANGMLEAVGDPRRGGGAVVVNRA